MSIQKRFVFFTSLTNMSLSLCYLFSGILIGNTCFSILDLVKSHQKEKKNAKLKESNTNVMSNNRVVMTLPCCGIFSFLSSSVFVFVFLPTERRVKFLHFLFSFNITCTLRISLHLLVFFLILLVLFFF